MAAGRIPAMESVVKFAQGFGLDVNEWLELTGYPRVEPTPKREPEGGTYRAGDFTPSPADLRRARQLGLDVASLRAHPDSEPAPPAARPSPDARLGAGILALAQRYDVPNLALRRFSGLGDLTHEKVDRILAELEEDLKAEQEEERQEEERRRQQGGGGA